MTPRRPWKRAAKVTGLGILLILVAALVYGNHRWQQLLESQGIERLSWHGPGLSSQGLSLRHLHMERCRNAGACLQIVAEQLLLGWPRHDASGWQLPQLRIGRLTLEGQPSPSTGDSSGVDALDWQALAALPRTLRLDAFSARLPCANGQCLLQGSLQAGHAGPGVLPANIRFELQHQDRRLALQVDLDGDLQRHSLALQASLLLDGEPRGRLSSRLLGDAAEQNWQGQLSIPALPEAPWLRDWLGEWLGPLPSDPALPIQDLHLEADWQLRWPQGPLEIQRLRETAQGEARMRARLPQPWPLAGVGLLQGEVALEMEATAGDWLPRQLQADLHLTQPQGSWLAAIPEALHPSMLQLQIQPLDEQAGKPPEDSSELSLGLHLQAQGEAQLDLQGELRILPRLPAWQIGLESGEIGIEAQRLALADSRLERLKARLHLSGRLDREHLQLSLHKGSRVTLGLLSLPDLHLERLQAELAGQTLTGEHAGQHLHDLRLSGPLHLQAQRLSHPRLRPQGWTWQGRLDAKLDRQRLDGTIRGERGLGARLQLERSANGALELDARLTEVFLRSGNPLATTLADWPALLELNKGRLQGSGRLRLRPGSPLQAEVELQPKGLAGIYDRSELHGLSGRLQAGLQGANLELELAGLRLEQINPGLPLGPLHLSGRYRTTLNRPRYGQLDWLRAELGLLGGRAWLAPGRKELSATPATFEIRLEDLQLSELFRLYPADGLAGQGILDGRLPVILGPAGLRIEDGRLANRGPGVLQFRSEQIRALARANPAMKLVTEALEDFHFGLLSSELGYDEQGKLLMDLRLEGRNPGLEKGRPIHFNINLEEDIPALLTSLQLTDRVSERIRQRVQQSLRKNSDAP